MSLTYEAKRRIIQHVASASNWRNDYDGDAIERNFGNWAISKNGNLSVQKLSWKALPTEAGQLYQGSNLKQVKITYEAKQGQKDCQSSFLHISMSEGKLDIHDESGRRIIKTYPAPFDKTSQDQNQTGIHIGGADAFSHHLNDKGLEIAEISELGITCIFHPNGEKAIYFEKERQTLAFDKPTGFCDEPMPAGGLLNVVSFDEYFARDIGIDIRDDFINSAKLVVAIDLGLEPNIRLLNKLDEDNLTEFMAAAMVERYDPDWKGPEQWRPKLKMQIGDISGLQKEWIDTVDFEGYYIGLPRQFGIAFHKNPDRYDFRHSADGKHHMIAQGKLLEAATDGAFTPTPVLQKNPPVQTIFHIVNTAGQTIRDQNNTPWHGIIVEADNAKILAYQVREMMRDHFGQDFASSCVSSINYDENHCMIAIQKDALDHANQSVRASKRVMTMIRDGERDKELFKELLKNGADLKYIEPEAARNGKSFADYLNAAGNTTLLKTLREEQGERDIIMHDDPPCARSLI